MPPSPSSDAARPTQSQRRFARGADRSCGIAQLSLLETALCPLDSRFSTGGFVHRAKYFYTPKPAAPDQKPRRKAANVRVSAPLGLLPNDEYNLWALLTLTFGAPEPESRLMATPHWCLKQLGVLRPGSPLYDPLKSIGFDDPAIRRIIRRYPARRIERWAEITLIAMEKNPKGFPGFKTSPQAFCMHGIKNGLTHPDWYFAEKKREERREWEEYRQAACDTEETASTPAAD